MKINEDKDIIQASKSTVVEVKQVNRYYRYVLSCGHWKLTFSPAIKGDVVTCYSCKCNAVYKKFLRDSKDETLF